MASVGSTPNTSQYEYKIMFQKCIYFNRYIYQAWILVIGMTLAEKVYSGDNLGNLTICLSVTVFILLVILEGARLAIGQSATAGNGVSEMGGFLLLTNFMQLPLVSYFLFNPLNYFPVEIVMNGCLWVLAIMETAYCYLELKEASASASNVYYAQLDKNNMCQASGDKKKTK